MVGYDKYFLMKEQDVPAYVQEKTDFFSKQARLICHEIGDGNLNYVFRVQDEKTGKTLIVKQAGEALRISKDMHLSTDRGRIEAKILGLQRKFAPGFVPEVYLYDGVMCAMIMEDMIGHKMMRTALLEHEIFPKFADQVSTFLAETLLQTTDLVMNHKEKKEYVKSFINPDLCEITEDLVFSEPYLDYNHRNHVDPAITDFITRELYEDETIHLEAAKLKFEFMNHAQALIHGDLHTGSVFINQEHAFFFDPEFAFYGPMGFDLGNVIANLFFAWCNGDAEIQGTQEREKFCQWCIDTIAEMIDLFKNKFHEIYREKVTDLMARTPGFEEWYLQEILSDTAGMAGMESIRRIDGMANVKDITSIQDEKKRARAEKIVVTLAKNYIINRASFQSGEDYRKAISEAINLF